MAREHTPRPGVTWERQLAPVEQLVADDAPPPPNRETRRALARQKRRTPKETRRA